MLGGDKGISIPLFKRKLVLAIKRQKSVHNGNVLRVNKYYKCYSSTAGQINYPDNSVYSIYSFRFTRMGDII